MRALIIHYNSLFIIHYIHYYSLFIKSIIKNLLPRCQRSRTSVDHKRTKNQGPVRRTNAQRLFPLSIYDLSQSVGSSESTSTEAEDSNGKKEEEEGKGKGKGKGKL